MEKQAKEKLIIYEIAGSISVTLSAFLFHFLYEWTGENFIIGLFAATNESVFEHTKIVFFPYIIYSFIEMVIIKPNNIKEFTAVKAATSILLPVIIITGFYTYSGIIGNHYLFADIALTVISVATAFYMSYIILSRHKISHKLYRIIYVIFFVVFILIMYFSIYPPHINLFYDYTKQIYGI